jgi:hypothetical protein
MDRVGVLVNPLHLHRGGRQVAALAGALAQPPHYLVPAGAVPRAGLHGM